MIVVVNTKINTTRNSKKSRNYAKPLLALVVVVALVLFGLKLWHDHRSTTPAKTSGPTVQQKAQQKTAEENQKLQETQTPKNTTPPNTGLTASNITLTTERASDGSLTVFTKLTNITDGTCQLIVTNGAASSTLNASIIYQPEYSSCAGFSVPTTDLGTGNWHIALTVTTSSGQASNSINVAVQ